MHRVYVVVLLASACGHNLDPPGRAVPFDGTFCTLPGSFVHEGGESYHIEGGPSGPRLAG